MMLSINVFTRRLPPGGDQARERVVGTDRVLSFC